MHPNSTAGPGESSCGVSGFSAKNRSNAAPVPATLVLPWSSSASPPALDSNAAEGMKDAAHASSGLPVCGACGSPLPEGRNDILAMTDCGDSNADAGASAADTAVLYSSQSAGKDLVRQDEAAGESLSELELAVHGRQYDHSHGKTLVGPGESCLCSSSTMVPINAAALQEPESMPQHSSMAAISSFPSLSFMLQNTNATATHAAALPGKLADLVAPQSDPAPGGTTPLSAAGTVTPCRTGRYA